MSLCKSIQSFRTGHVYFFLFAHLFSIRLANINLRYFTLKTKFQFDTCSFTTNRPEGWARSIFFQSIRYNGQFQPLKKTNFRLPLVKGKNGAFDSFMIFSVFFLLKFLLFNDVNFINDVTEKYFAFHDCFFSINGIRCSQSAQSAKKCPKTIAFSIIVVKSFLNFLKKSFTVYRIGRRRH